MKLPVSKINKFGIFFRQLGVSQAVYEAVIQSNKYVSEHFRDDISIFYGDALHRIEDNLFGIIHVNAAWSFDGIGIATNIYDAILLAGIPTIRRKIFYVYDLEWYGAHRQPYDKCVQAYRSPKLELWARCQDHANVIEQCFNVKVKGINSDFGLEKFLCQDHS